MKKSSSKKQSYKHEVINGRKVSQGRNHRYNLTRLGRPALPQLLRTIVVPGKFMTIADVRDRAYDAGIDVSYMGVRWALLRRPHDFRAERIGKRLVFSRDSR